MNRQDLKSGEIYKTTSELYENAQLFMFIKHESETTPVSAGASKFFRFWDQKIIWLEYSLKFLEPI